MNLIEEMAKLGYDMETFPGGPKWTTDMGYEWPYRKQTQLPKPVRGMCECGNRVWIVKSGECKSCYDKRLNREYQKKRPPRVNACECGAEKSYWSKTCKTCKEGAKNG